MANRADISENSRRIAKNTVFLYVRMVVMILVGLYTSRVLLNALGQDDYGTYGAVGGVVALFGVLTGSFAGAISRFIASEMGKKESRLDVVFSSTVFIQLVLAAAVVILAELFGLWFLNAKMSIPAGRLGAANWVFHCSVLIFVVNMLSVPYNASIIAHEKMEAFAYISIVEAVLALGVAIATRYTNYDKLKFYSVLMLAVALSVRFIYGIYAKSHFGECRFRARAVEIPVIKEIGSFAGWTFLGNGAAILNAQGINILFNLFFGVRINAARDVTSKLDTNMSRFVNNITTAINPQINKSYMGGGHAYLHELTCKGSKYSYILFLFFALPIILEAPALLTLWLGTVPAMAENFVRVALVMSAFVSLGTPFATAVFATGNVRNYEIVASLSNVMAFPLSYVAFKCGGSPVMAYWIMAGTAFLVLIERMVFASVQTGLKLSKIWNDTLSRVILVTITAVPVPLLLYLFQDACAARTIEVVLVSFFTTAVSAFFVGATSGERQAIVNSIKSKIK